MTDKTPETAPDVTPNVTVEFLIHRNEELSRELRGLQAAFRILEKRHVENEITLAENSEAVRDLLRRSGFVAARVFDVETRVNEVENDVAELGGSMAVMENRMKAIEDLPWTPGKTS